MTKHSAVVFKRDPFQQKFFNVYLIFTVYHPSSVLTVANTVSLGTSCRPVQDAVWKDYQVQCAVHQKDMGRCIGWKIVCSLPENCQEPPIDWKCLEWIHAKTLSNNFRHLDA